MIRMIQSCTKSNRAISNGKRKIRQTGELHATSFLPRRFVVQFRMMAMIAKTNLKMSILHITSTQSFTRCFLIFGLGIHRTCSFEMLTRAMVLLRFDSDLSTDVPSTRGIVILLYRFSVVAIFMPGPFILQQ